MKTVKIKDINRIKEYISEIDTCFLSMIDADGIPCSFPMNFGYSNDTIFFHSAPEGGMYEYVKAGKPVSITFCTNRELVYQTEKIACSYRMRAASVIARGELIIVEDMEEKVEALNATMKQYSSKEFTYRDPAVRNVFIFKMENPDFTCRAFGVPHHESLKMK